MLLYRDGTDVYIGDHVVHGQSAAVVEEIIEGEHLAQWSLDRPGFMILCDECGRVLIDPCSADWEDVAFVRRGA